MAGKEALSDLYYSNLDKFIDIKKVNNQVGIIKQELAEKEKLEQKLTKYKMAFEIFKRFVEKGNYVDLQYGVFDGTVDISDEEIELLEELLES